jgi:RNA polymerase sigma-70 factor, ECF subfamily
VQVPPELIERLQAKDPTAYDEFMEQFGQNLLRISMHICGNREDAKEVVQDTLMKTFQSVRGLRQRAGFAGWIYRIATNACLMKRRKSKFLGQELPLEDLLPDRAELSQGGPAWNRPPDMATLDGELYRQIRAAIMNLPENYRSILVLRDLNGLDADETALALGLSKDVAKMRLHRARAMVRTAIEESLASSRPIG